MTYHPDPPGHPRPPMTMDQRKELANRLLTNSLLRKGIYRAGPFHAVWLTPHWVVHDSSTNCPTWDGNSCRCMTEPL